MTQSTDSTTTHDNSHLTRYSRFRWFIQVTIPLVALIATSGCSDGRPARVAVSGKVLIDGKPLTMGIVQFVPEGSRPSAGKLDSEGRFTLTCYDGDDGIVPGTHQVMVAAKEMISESKARWLAPPKYADFRKSGLSFEITEPTDDLVIELTWDGGKPFVK
jgi:hypothetical protein